jgi:hypothetical protein
LGLDRILLHLKIKRKMFNVNKQIFAFTIIMIAFLLFLLFKSIDLSEEFCSSSAQLCFI